MQKQELEFQRRELELTREQLERSAEAQEKMADFASKELKLKELELTKVTNSMEVVPRFELQNLRFNMDNCQLVISMLVRSNSLKYKKVVIPESDFDIEHSTENQLLNSIIHQGTKLVLVFKTKLPNLAFIHGEKFELHFEDLDGKTYRQVLHIDQQESVMSSPERVISMEPSI
ncbi:MAG: hypothetical protein HEP71_34325 [Roseivirga sp.]|nr:hypothetical protein [Roseivirga sp.]